jgi:predicted outer membrane repeat protein
MIRLLTSSLLAAGFVCVSGFAHAASVSVGASCSMRNAVTSVNNNSTAGTNCVKSGFGTINVINVPAGTYTDGAELNVTRSVTIVGAGRDSTTFSSGGVWAFMASGANAPVFEIRNMTVKKSSTQPLGCIGLRVNSPARLVLNGARVSGFNSNAGVWLTGGGGQGLTANSITNSLIENNVTTGVRADEADVNVVTSTISGNGGGGVSLRTVGYLNIDDSILRDNTSGGNGGGIYVDGGSSAQVRVNRSLIKNNRAANFGGGIYSQGQIYFWNNTFTGNRALRGGAYYHVGAESYLFHNTIAGNLGDQRAGGVYNNSSQSIWSYNIIANNTAPSTPDAEVVFITATFNLIENTSGWDPGFQMNNILGFDPMLGALTTYTIGSRTTQAFPLLLGSIAIDAISSDAGDTVTVDQRGVARPFNFPGNGRSGYDIGSIEQQ